MLEGGLRGFGTSAASRTMKSPGSKITCALPSRYVDPDGPWRPPERYVDRDQIDDDIIPFVGGVIRRLPHLARRRRVEVADDRQRMSF
jgi:hypothetical protein